MLLLSRDDVDKVFTMREAIDCVKTAFELLSQGRCQVPLRTNIQVPSYNASMLVMPAYIGDLDAMSIKVISLFPKNAGKGLPSSPAQIMLFDGKTGMVEAMLDGTYVTAVRTGAASGLAFELLAKKCCAKGALIGTGGQGEKQLEAMITARELEEVYVFDTCRDRRVAFAERMNARFSGRRPRIVAAETSDEAVEGADLLITVTPSAEPVFDASKVAEGATVSCVGSYQPFMQEMDPMILRRASKIFTDSTGAVLSESGDIIKAIEEGIIIEEDITGEIGDVSLGNIKGRENDSEIIVFETVGVAAQDLVTSKAIYESAIRGGAGTKWGE